jgi:mono/diheme cytochrome c family protein
LARVGLSLLAFFCATPGLHADPPATSPRPAQATAKADPNAIYRAQIAPLMKKYCLECHGADAQEGDVRFDGFKDAAAVAADHKTWERAIQMLRSGAMPPDDGEQPTEAERRKIVAWVEKTIYNFDCDGEPDPGRVTIRRLNRAEYNNTVRDLLGVTFKPADDFPSDDVGSGFDNIGDVLTLPPLLMEKYLAAAERIAEEVIVTDTSVFVKSQFKFRDSLRGDGSARYDFSQNSRRWTIYADGSVWAEFDFPRAGLYSLRVSAAGQQAGDQPPQMELRLDGQKLKVFDVNATQMRTRYEIKWQVPQGGMHRLSAHFLNDLEDPTAEDPKRRDRNLQIDAFEVDGPLDFRLEDYPPAHQKLVAVRPEGQRSITEAAKANLQPLLSRAFRRPATTDELNRFAMLVDRAVQQGDSFEQGVQVALTGVLISPHFLFRAEGNDRAADPTAIRPIGSYDLASRLSYFLWSSMPDDKLLAVAAAGKLQEEAVIEQQVRRMLADPKCDALVQNFVTQWLNLRLLDGVVPDPQAFPQFDAKLKADMRRETELFAAAIIREDKSVLDFLGGRFTFVNERLAKHYGLSGVSGDEFQRVAFTDIRHTGVLTQASVLTLTSNPGRTSPVKRGKWMLENILGSPPPDPPPDAPDLEATQKNQPDLPLRKQLEIHRQNAVCASCHKVMDQLGFGLENFDAIGRWREKDGAFAIDASGELPGGAKFNGPVALAKVLDKRRGEFVRCLSEKMLTFALGRELAVQDRCAVDKIVEQVESREYRFSSLVTAIASSDPFRKVRSDSKPSDTVKGDGAIP